VKALVLLSTLGCVMESQSATSPEVDFVGVELVDSYGNTWEADRATMDADGGGSGWGIRASLGVDDGGAPIPELKITADRSSWDLKSRTIQFEGNVVATRGDMKLTCARLDVWMGEGDDVEHAAATGGVRVTQGDRDATGREAKLTTERGELVITGEPMVREGGTSFSGERVTLWLDDERMECEGCEVVVQSPGVDGP
jgi:lipopolysaccharide transport protein LptA